MPADDSERFCQRLQIIGFIRMSSIQLCCVESIVLSKVLDSYNYTDINTLCAASRYVTHILSICSDPNVRISFTGFY